MQVEDQRFMDDLKRHILALEAQVAEHERTIRSLSKENEALQTTASTDSEVTKKAEESEKKAKANEEKFHKMKDVYNKLREEHIGLLRTKAEVEKQLASAKTSTESVEKVRQDLGEQLRLAVEEKMAVQEKLGELTLRTAEADVVVQENNRLKDGLQDLGEQLRLAMEEKVAVQEKLGELALKSAEADVVMQENTRLKDGLQASLSLKSFGLA